MGLVQTNTKKENTRNCQLTHMYRKFVHLEIETCFQETAKFYNFAGNLTTCEMNMINKI